VHTKPVRLAHAWPPVTAERNLEDAGWVTTPHLPRLPPREQLDATRCRLHRAHNNPGYGRVAAKHRERIGVATGRNGRNRIVHAVESARHASDSSKAGGMIFVWSDNEKQEGVPVAEVYARFATTEGAFMVRLFGDKVPKTVDNFLALAEGTKEWTDPRTRKKTTAPYYDGVVFHRVIDGFMVQTGDPLGQGTGGPGYTFADEFDSSLHHDRQGILSMANAGPNTNGGQFFITLGPTPHLDNRHSVFGEVTEGMDVVRQIGSAATGSQDRPLKDITIETVTIERRD
jgi:peptidyl-prolyl cis-trans isomerase A (cyclophilin A)